MNTLRKVGPDLVLKTRFNIVWLREIKQIPGSRWNPEKKTWKIPYSDSVKEQIKTLVIPLKDMTEDSQLIDAEHIKKRREWIAKEHKALINTERYQRMYHSLTKPYKHQALARDFLTKHHNHAALLMEMGTGKTKVMIDYLVSLHKTGKCDRIIWVCPNSVTENTMDEIIKHSAAPVNAFIVRGLAAKKIRIIEEARKSESLTIIILNYEAVFNLFEHLAAFKADAAVLDESTRIKNPKAQVSKVLCRLCARTTHRYIMTGTPMTQSPVDLFSQYKFLDPEIFGSSFFSFKCRYLVMGGWENREIVGYNNLEELKKKVFQIGIRFLKEECLDLPPKIYEVRQYDLENEQRRVYEEMKKNLISEIAGKFITVSVALVKLLRLSQICSGFYRADESEKVTRFKSNPKLQLLKEVIEEIGTDKNIIIWCRFVEEIKILEEEFARMKLYSKSIYGAVKAEDRAGIIKEFNNRERSMIFIGQVRTGGLGINLIGGCNVIYFSNSYSLEDRLQSEDRTHRIGQENKVTYTDIIGRKTLEEGILKLLRRKKDIADYITMESLKEIL